MSKEKGNRYDVVAIKETKDKDGEKKVYFKKVGVGWPMKEKKGLVLEMDAHSLSGKYLVMPYVPKEKKESSSDY